jgi:Helix-loop-helix DNA-binding domain
MKLSFMKALAYTIHLLISDCRSEIDSKTIMERLRKRKENHNHIERKRRDHINHTIFELAEILPQIDSKDIKANKGSILKATLQHIKVYIHKLQRQQ